MTVNRAALRLLVCAVLAAAPPVLPGAETEEEPAASTLVEQTREAELAGFKAAIARDDVGITKQTCADIAFTGITDVELFDQIERVVLRDYELTRREGSLVASIPSCIRALASSGNPKYHELVVSSVDRKPDRGMGWRYARAHMARSVGLLEKFPAWNATINSTVASVPGEPPGVTRIRNMLRAEDPLLVMEGIRRARPVAPRYPALYDLAEQLLMAQLNADTKERLDNAAWFCKLLGESGNSKYVPSLQVVAAKATNEKIRRHAEKALDRLQDGS